MWPVCVLQGIWYCKFSQMHYVVVVNEQSREILMLYSISQYKGNTENSWHGCAWLFPCLSADDPVNQGCWLELLPLWGTAPASLALMNQSVSEELLLLEWCTLYWCELPAWYWALVPQQQQQQQQQQHSESQQQRVAVLVAITAHAGFSLLIGWCDSWGFRLSCVHFISCACRV